MFSSTLLRLMKPNVLLDHVGGHLIPHCPHKIPVVPEEKVEPILAGLRPLFDRHSGVMFVADVAGSRQEYFSKPQRGA